jgi:hypothetical protein
MNRRERIFVAAAAAAAVVGALVLFAGSPTGPGRTEGENARQDTAEWAAPVRQSVAQAAAGRLRSRILESAERPWEEDPFYRRPRQPGTARGSSGPSRPAFSYTGYIEYGRTCLAVINGREYAPGESLNAEGYVLKRAGPERAVIQGESGTFSVPFESGARSRAAPAAD